LEITNLYDVRGKHVAGYSGGMKQRFGIAQLLLNNPKLIIVDEPTAGLDPAERHRFLNGGRILKHTTPQEATKEIEGTIWTKIINREDLDAIEQNFNLLSSNYNQDNTLNVRVHAAEKPAEGFEKTAPQLDDVYFIALKQDEPVIA
jgi:ABC-type multidrug transport system ATPase subunit